MKIEQRSYMTADITTIIVIIMKIMDMCLEGHR